MCNYITVFLVHISLFLQAQNSDVPCNGINVLNENIDCTTVETFDFFENESIENFPVGCIEPVLTKWFRFFPSNTFVSIYLENIFSDSLSAISLSVFQTENCENDFTEIICTSSGDNNWIHVELPYLKTGRTYLVQVGKQQDDGSELKLCVNSYFPFKSPGNTCEEASIICDDETKILVPGEGNQNIIPINTNLCNVERPYYNQSWYKWRADSDGEIAFTLTPFLSNNNIDFAFYKINDGIDGCDLELIRCESVLNGDGNECGVNTGLREGYTANFLSSECNNGDGSYLAPVSTIRGELFALQVMSTNENAGYTLKFNNSIKIFDPVGLGFGSVLSQVGECTYRRKYTSNGQENYIWDIGPFSEAEGSLDGNEIYILTDSLGTSNIQVSSETSFGCILTEVDSLCLLEHLSITSLFDLRIDSIKGIECGQIDGSYLEISMDVSCDDYTGFEYSIDGGPFTKETIYRDLALGEHEVRVRLDESCEISRSIFIEQEVNFSGIINVERVNPESCIKEYNFSIDLTGELSGSETVIWDFGPDASSGNIDGIGPHLVQINNLGINDIRAIISAGTECSKEIIYKLNIPTCDKDILPEIFIVNETKADCNDENGSIAIEVEGGCGPYQYYLNNQSILPSKLDSLASGQYFLEVIDIDSCVASLNVFIEKEENLFLNAGPDITTSIIGEVYDFDLTYNYPDVIISTNSQNIQCLDGPDCLQPSLQISGSENIIFTAENSAGCMASDSVRVSVDFDPESVLYLPNVFSPNDDGINDKFEIHFPDAYMVKVEQFEVFDRWGNKVFILENSKEGKNNIPLWDGRSLGSPQIKTAVYVFVGTFKVSQGSIEKEVVISRSITIIR